MTDKKKILICDDEEGIRESFKLILGEQYDLVFTCSGSECLDTLKIEKNISLVLMDIKMPKQNGIEITKEIKRLFPSTKVIIVTGYESVEIAQEATSSGADAYITKPFETRYITNVVNNSIGT